MSKASAIDAVIVFTSFGVVRVIPVTVIKSEEVIGVVKLRVQPVADLFVTEEAFAHAALVKSAPERVTVLTPEPTS